MIFALASAWCGFAPDIRHLIIARALQGLGAALLVPGSLAIISSSFRDEERGRAMTQLLGHLWQRHADRAYTIFYGPGHSRTVAMAQNLGYDTFR